MICSCIWCRSGSSKPVPLFSRDPAWPYCSYRIFLVLIIPFFYPSVNYNDWEDDLVSHFRSFFENSYFENQISPSPYCLLP